MGDDHDERDERDDTGDGADDTERDWRDDYLDEQLGQQADPATDPAAPTPMSRFRHGSLGVTLGAAMTGLGNVLEPSKKEEPAVIVEHDEPDQSNERLELHLDRDDPSASVVIIRKWIDDHKREPDA